MRPFSLKSLLEAEPQTGQGIECTISNLQKSVRNSSNFVDTARNNLHSAMYLKRELCLWCILIPDVERFCDGAMIYHSNVVTEPMQNSKSGNKKFTRF